MKIIDTTSNSLDLNKCYQDIPNNIQEVRRIPCVMLMPVVSLLSNFITQKVLEVQISFRRFLSKSIYCERTVHNVLFKVMAIASHYFFPSFW